VLLLCSLLVAQASKAAGFALAGATLTFLGFMHGEKIGIGQTPVAAVSYFAVSLILVSCAKFATVTAKATVETADHAPAGLPEPAA
jgi:adenine/guanine/hypoxanthine permease